MKRLRMPAGFRFDLVREAGSYWGMVVSTEGFIVRTTRSWSSLSALNREVNGLVRELRSENLLASPIRFARDGRMVLNRAQSRYVHRILLSRRCCVCHAKAGKPCNDMKAGGVHMGRVPAGYDAVETLKELGATT